MSKRSNAARTAEPEAFDRRLHIMISESQWTKLVALAAARGLTPSAYLRQMIATATA
jgi:predicted DNA binding CopG/RHH family protein